MNKLFHLGRILSLDVVLGALASTYMAVVYLEVKMPIVFWFALALSVWVIYTADHLLDAYRLKDEAHTERHLFHHYHFKLISTIFLLGLLICLFVLPFFVPAYMLYFAIGMGLFTGIHFLLVKWIGDKTSLFFLKELGVGLIYSLGVWGPPLLAKYPELTEVDMLVYVQFFLLAMINLFTFSMYEIDTDEIDGHTSFIRAIGVKGARALLLCLSLLVLSMGIFLLPQNRGYLNEMEAIYFLMLGVLIWVFLDEKRFRPNHRYRAWADAVFLFPVFMVFFSLDIFQIWKS